MAKRQEPINFGSIIFGISISILVTVITGAIVANAVLRGRIGELTLPWVVAIALFCASLLGTFLAGLKYPKEAVILRIGVSTGFTIMLILFGLLLFDGKILSPWIQICGIGAGCLVSLITDNKRKVKVTKKKH